jgi:hypothetical protein
VATKRPRALRGSAEIQRVGRPMRASATATLDSAPATCRRSDRAVSRGMSQSVDRRIMLSPRQTTGPFIPSDYSAQLCKNTIASNSIGLSDPRLANRPSR